MCLAAPGKILSINKEKSALKMAKVSFAGILKDICIEWVPEVKEGDYVMVHVGTALCIVDRKEAEETLKIFNQWADELGDNE